MPDTVDIERFLELTADHPVFDVRTPSEYGDGHIPGAQNLPLFSDEDRAEVGTAYKQKGRHDAIKIGLDIVGPKMRALVEAVEAVVPVPDPVLLHCWRGGMRSSSVGWLLELYGYDVVLLDGGYKRYRNWVLDILETDFDSLAVVGGLTGSGKTEVLHRLADAGEQVLDLEGLARHRGSAFGAIGQEPRTQQNFDNRMAERITELDTSRRVWVEDESRMVGRCAIPDAFWDQKQRAPIYFYELSQERRIARLVADYGDLPGEPLRSAFEDISKRLGGRRTELALEALDAGDLEPACREALKYYDKAYRYHMEKRTAPRIEVDVDDDATMAEIAQALIDEASSN
ncbi:MAG: tRNA 2-selenouridine(34) synthase MnmH [Myxococcota bacterium]